MSFPWVCNSHSELTATTTWWSHRDDLTNNLQQIHGVSCKLMKRSWQAHSVSSSYEFTVGYIKSQNELTMSFIWAHSELAVSSKSSLSIISKTNFYQGTLSKLDMAFWNKIMAKIQKLKGCQMFFETRYTLNWVNFIHNLTLDKLIYLQLIFIYTSMSH